MESSIIMEVILNPKKITPQFIRKFESITLDNQEFQDRIKGDDVRSCEIMFIEKRNTWLIWFNGSIVHSSKTWISSKKKLDKLIDDWHLEIIDTI